MSSLRTYYGQSRRKYLSSKNKSGSGADEVKKSAQPYFIRQSAFFKARQSTSNLNLSNWGSGVIDINTVTASTLRNSRKHPNSNNVTQQEFLSKTLCIVLSEGAEKEKAKTDDQIFWKLIASSMAKVPEGDIKDELKISIQQLILSSKRRALKKGCHSEQLYTSGKSCTSTNDFIF